MIQKIELKPKTGKKYPYIGIHCNNTNVTLFVSPEKSILLKSTIEVNQWSLGMVKSRLEENYIPTDKYNLFLSDEDLTRYSKDLQDEISDLREEKIDLHNELERLQKEYEQLNNIYGIADMECTVQKQANEDLKAENDKLKAEISSLKSKISRDRADVAQINEIANRVLYTIKHVPEPMESED